MITEQEEEQPAPGGDDFLRATEHVPGEISEDKTAEFAGVNAPPAQAPGAATIANVPYPQWTVEQVAAVFDGVFTVLVFSRMFVPFGGEHWNIPSEKTQLLGVKFLPIFQRHVPWSADTNASLIPTVLMWVGALGAVKIVCGQAIQTEIQLYQLAKLQAEARRRGIKVPGMTANTGMGTSPASTSQPENGNQARPSTSGESSTSPNIEE